MKGINALATIRVFTQDGVEMISRLNDVVPLEPHRESMCECAIQMATLVVDDFYHTQLREYLTKSRGKLYCRLLGGIDLFVPFDVRVKVVHRLADSLYRFWGVYRFHYSDDEGLVGEVVWYNERERVSPTLVASFDEICSVVLANGLVRVHLEQNATTNGRPANCTACPARCDFVDKSVLESQMQLAYRREDLDR